MRAADLRDEFNELLQKGQYEKAEQLLIDKGPSSDDPAAATRVLQSLRNFRQNPANDSSGNVIESAPRRIETPAMNDADGQTYSITGINENDMLSIRAGAGSRYPVVTRLSNGAGGIRITGAKVWNGSDDWVPISFEGGTGWTRPKYLSSTASGDSSSVLERRKGQPDLNKGSDTVNNAPSAFRYYYRFDDPGYRLWIHVGDYWKEKQPSGKVNRFKTNGRGIVDGFSGTIIASVKERGFEVFVDDKEMQNPRLYFRRNGGEWTLLGSMEDIK